MLGSIFRSSSRVGANCLVVSGGRTLSISQQPQKHDAFVSVISAELEKIKQAGTYKSERIITSPQNAHIQVVGTKGMYFLLTEKLYNKP